MGIQNINRRRLVQEEAMIDEQKQKTDLQELLKETTVALGGTDQTYIQFVQMLNDYDQLSIPNRLLPGCLVFFKYKPISESFISRNTYYDSFPLVLITDVYRGGFEGVNLHFIAPQYRKALFDAVMRGLPTIKANEEWRTRLRVDYDRLEARRIFKYYKPCYRRYLWKGMKRRPALVPFQLWEDMVNGNSYKFVGAKPVTVYRDSRNAVIRGGR
jgi:hypothetical protein